MNELNIDDQKMMPSYKTFILRHFLSADITLNQHFFCDFPEHSSPDFHHWTNDESFEKSVKRHFSLTCIINDRIGELKRKKNGKMPLTAQSQNHIVINYWLLMKWLQLIKKKTTTQEERNKNAEEIKICLEVFDCCVA